MVQNSAKSASGKRSIAKQQTGSSAFDFSEMTVEESKPTPKATSRNKAGGKPQQATTSRSVNYDLNPIDDLVPYNRRFLNLAGEGPDKSGKTSVFGKFGSAAKGLFNGSRTKLMDKEEMTTLRNKVGDLKNTKVVNHAPSNTEAPAAVATPVAQKTKSQRLQESRQKISEKSKEPQKDKHLIGLRIEIERLKRQYPGDGNLTILDAILTSRDGCLIHRTNEERVASLAAALKEASFTVANKYLTTYAVETLFDIYFLYLESLKKYFAERLRKVSSDKRNSQAAIESVRRDIRVLNLLLEQKKYQKTIISVGKKLHAFNHAYEPISALDIAKSFSNSGKGDNEKIGPGTVKSIKFMVKNYLNVFAQIPMLQPIARKLAASLPDDIESKLIKANMDMDNAYTQIKISKLGNDKTVAKQMFALFNYGKQIINSTIKDNAASAPEARILLRTGEMAEEFAFLNDKVEPEILKSGLRYATMAIGHYKNEAQAVIRRVHEIAELRKLDLQSTGE